MVTRHPVADLLQNGLDFVMLSNEGAKEIDLRGHALGHGGGADAAVRRPPGDAAGGAWVYREERLHFFSPQFWQTAHSTSTGTVGKSALMASIIVASMTAFA